MKKWSKKEENNFIVKSLSAEITDNKDVISKEIKKDKVFGESLNIPMPKK